MEAIIYTRWSPRPDAETCESSEVQLGYCRPWCEQNNHKIIAELDDPDSSGGDAKRPGLWEAMQLAKNRLLVVYRKDRLVRSVMLSEILHEQMERQKTTLHCVMGGNCDVTPEGKITRRVIAAADEFYKDINALRTKYSMLQHQRNGRLMSRHPPYGTKLGTPQTIRDYKGVPRERQTLVPCREELAAMALMSELHAAGATYGEVADALNAKGGAWLCRGGKWTRKGVQRCIMAKQKVG